MSLLTVNYSIAPYFVTPHIWNLRAFVLFFLKVLIVFSFPLLRVEMPTLITMLFNI